MRRIHRFLVGQELPFRQEYEASPQRGWCSVSIRLTGRLTRSQRRRRNPHHVAVAAGSELNDGGMSFHLLSAWNGCEQGFLRAEGHKAGARSQIVTNVEITCRTRILHSAGVLAPVHAMMATAPGAGLMALHMATNRFLVPFRVCAFWMKHDDWFPSVNKHSWSGGVYPRRWFPSVNKHSWSGGVYPRRWFPSVNKHSWSGGVYPRRQGKPSIFFQPQPPKCHPLQATMSPCVQVHAAVR